jgi:hypothetical protein
MVARGVLTAVRTMRIRLLLLPLVLASSPAWALKPSKHRELAEAACNAQKLPSAFCERMGQQVFETDYQEWTTPAAHAQRELGQDRCEAADDAAIRVRTFGRDLVSDAHAGKYEDAAVALGRAIHTLQDECAHHGMTNEEHAFYSMEDMCGDDVDVSPDTQPNAISCAESRTNDAMAEVAAALADVRWSGVDYICRDSNDQDSCQLASLPSPFQACDFLALHKNWDGTDSTWNGDVVGPALVDAFEHGLVGDIAYVPVCAAPGAIDPIAPHPLVTDRETGCTLTDIACFGKADAPGAAPADAGGCAVGGSPGLLLALLALRRKKR